MYICHLKCEVLGNDTGAHTLELHASVFLCRWESGQAEQCTCAPHVLPGCLVFLLFWLGYLSP